MTRTARVVAGVTKEIRELSLAWLASLVAIVAMAPAGSEAVRIMGLIAYFYGTAALGALSIGHEYSHGTLGVLLSQPARRERLLFVKLGVLAVMLLALGLVAHLVMRSSSPLSDILDVLHPQGWYALFGWLPVLGGLFIAPWLTMLFRGPLAATFFTAGVPWAVFWVGQLVGMSLYGLVPAARLLIFDDPELVVFAVALVEPGTLAVCVVGAAMTWRMFVRLEAIESRGPEVGLPQWLLARTTRNVASPLPTTPRHPVWLLVKKELRVQQAALLAAGLYFACWLPVASLNQLDLVASLTKDGGIRDTGDILAGLTVIYAAAISSLIGSLASAEERQLGTLEWQMLLPMAAAKQWAVKVGLALGLALLLALGLPALLWSVRIGLWELVQLAVPVVLLTVVGLYVSSLSTSGLRALLASLLAMLGAALSLNVLFSQNGRIALLAMSRSFSRIVPHPLTPADQRVINAVALLLTAGFFAVMLRLALANHRSSDRAAGRGWSQTAWIAGSLITGVTLLAGVAHAISIR